MRMLRWRMAFGLLKTNQNKKEERPSALLKTNRKRRWRAAFGLVEEESEEKMKKGLRPCWRGIGREDEERPSAWWRENEEWPSAIRKQIGRKTVYNNPFNLTCPLSWSLLLATLADANFTPIRFAERAAQVKGMLQRPFGRRKKQERPSACWRQIKIEDEDRPSALLKRNRKRRWRTAFGLMKRKRRMAFGHKKANRKKNGL